MRRTACTLLFALLLQLLAGSAWAWRGSQATGHSSHCHDTVVQTASTMGDHHAGGKDPARSTLADQHHCCAVGVGIAIQPLPQPLPQALPASQPMAWISQSLRPDLRPPI